MCAVLGPEDIVRLRDTAVDDIVSVLYVSRGEAVRILRRFGWDANKAQEGWFAEQARAGSKDREQRSRWLACRPRSCSPLLTSPPPHTPPPPQEVLANEIGVSVGSDRPDVAPQSQQADTCPVCIEPKPASELRASSCGHFLCHSCWRGYVAAAFDGGVDKILDLRCPQPDCKAAVLPDVYRPLVEPEVMTRVNDFELRDLVDARRSLVRCPAPQCDRVVHSAAAGRPVALGPGAEPERTVEVACSCGKVFCARCMAVHAAEAEPHRPASCDHVRAWTEKSSTESANLNWILVNTKAREIERQERRFPPPSSPSPISLSLNPCRPLPPPPAPPNNSNAPHATARSRRTADACT